MESLVEVVRRLENEDISVLWVDVTSPEVADPGFDTSPALEPAPQPARLADILRSAPPTWHVDDDLQPPRAEPDVRTPAGSYLPPSAVLPALDGRSAQPAGGAASGSIAAAPAPSVASSGSWSVRRAFDSLGVTGSLARRTVGVGAGIAAISFLLPWVNGLPGAGLDGYIDRWGLAGSGLWIMFAAIALLGAVALSAGRPATWPIGIPAIVLGGILAGLVWPLVFGRGGAIGVWFGVVGAILMIVGGAFEVSLRHDQQEPVV
jgi:hypothetical protein